MLYAVITPTVWSCGVMKQFWEGIVDADKFTAGLIVACVQGLIRLLPVCCKVMEKGLIGATVLGRPIPPTSRTTL